MLKRYKATFITIAVMATMLMLLKREGLKDKSAGALQSPFICLELIMDFHLQLNGSAKPCATSPVLSPGRGCPSNAAGTAPLRSSALLCP